MKRTPALLARLVALPARRACAALAALLVLLLALVLSESARADAADPKTTVRPAQASEGAARRHLAEAAPPSESASCPQRCAPCTSSEHPDEARASSEQATNEGVSAPRPIDLNKADERALLELPGIGPARARAILAYRVSHGAFHSIAQLLHIKGIGRALLKQLRPLVTLSGGSS